MFFSYRALSEGMILVLEAPLLESPDNTSKVVGSLRKGDMIWIHDRYFREADYQKVEL